MDREQLSGRIAAHADWVRTQRRNDGVEPWGAQLDLTGADMREADLRGAFLPGALLPGADLRGADLCGADLREADLRGADLRGAKLAGADVAEADFGGAKLDGTDLSAVKGWEWAWFDRWSDPPALAGAGLSDAQLMCFPKHMSGRGTCAPLSDAQKALDGRIREATAEATATLAGAAAQRDRVEDERKAATAALRGLLEPKRLEEFLPQAVACSGCSRCADADVPYWERRPGGDDVLPRGHVVALSQAGAAAAGVLERGAEEHRLAEAGRIAAIPAAVERVRAAYAAPRPKAGRPLYAPPRTYRERREAALAAGEEARRAEGALNAARAQLSALGADPKAAKRLPRAAEALVEAVGRHDRAVAALAAAQAALAQPPEVVERELDDWVRYMKVLAEPDSLDRQERLAAERWIREIGH